MIAGIYQSIIFAPFFFYNVIQQAIEEPDSLKTMCPGFSGIPLPCALMYSRIPISMNVLYPLTIAIFTAYRFRQTLINLVFFTSEQYKFSYENESSDFQVSMMLFNAWEFKVDNPIDFKS